MAKDARGRCLVHPVLKHHQYARARETDCAHKQFPRASMGWEMNGWKSSHLWRRRTLLEPGPLAPEEPAYIACYDGAVTRLLLALVSAVLLTGISSGQKSHPPNSAPAADCGHLSGQIFKCLKFGFIYDVRFGWVDRTAEMATPQDADATQPVGSETLLALFERPPEAAGDTINSAVVIAAESLKNYPGVKHAADYFGPVTDLAEKRGFKVEGEPYEFAIGPKKLVRADYSKPRGSLTMYQSTLAMIEKGNIVSFTFVGGSKDE